MVKKAAAMANLELGVLTPEVASAIVAACNRLIKGEFADQFPSDMIQGGAGTSVNMNANEVIANIGLEYMGHKKGEYEFLHPNNHVNCSQSTNDAYPTAFRIALYFKVNELLEALDLLQNSFAEKGVEFERVLKMGRTQLQDAVPMSLGAEFKAFSVTLKEDIKRIREVQVLLLEVNMGATAIGTAINAPANYPKVVTDYLGKITHLPITLAEDLIEATSDTGAFVFLSGVLKRTAVKISKICNDLRLLSSGPRVGLNEINLPQLQPGSSIMPGKVNPVIPEMVNQTAYYVIGADLTITMAAEAGQLQLNVMEPVIAFSLFNMLSYLANAFVSLKEKCVDGITANEKECYDMVMNSVGIVTSLNPLLGYEECSAIAKEALKSGKSVHQIVVDEKGLLSQDKWDEIYSFENMIHPQFIAN
ncbi:Aspartate ammonia-lyase [compost metagenome]